MFGLVNKLGVLGSVVGTVVNLGCCASVLGPFAGVVLAGGLLDQVPTAWQLPLLYGSLAIALVGFGLGWRRHRRLYPMLIFLPGAAALLYPFHEALDLSLFQLLIWAGFGLLIIAAIWDTWLSVRAPSCRVSGSRLEVSQ